MVDLQAVVTLDHTLDRSATEPQRPPVPSKGIGSRVPWRTLPFPAQLYILVVIVGGIVSLTFSLPRTAPPPVLFLMLLSFACLTSAWKVNLLIPVANGSTLSVSYAANLMSLLLLGPSHAVLIAMAGAWVQCRYKAKAPYPVYRTVFSAAAAAITMAATGAVYVALDGTTPIESFAPVRPFVGAIAGYFLVNTGLVAGAIAFSSRRSWIETWRQDFLWSGASFMVAGTAGALAALVVQRGDGWKAVLLVAPIYLTYRTYELFAGRLEDQKRHTDEIQRLHNETIAALRQTRSAERALAEEKERLAVALAGMTRLEELRLQLLEREQTARASAEEANRVKDQFLAIVSHELRTPLNSILGWSDMLSKGTLDAQLRDRAVRGIGQGARRQARLIDDLLDVARIASGKMRLDRSLVDLRDVIRDALLVAQPTAQEKRISVVVDADASVGKVYGDPARLQQVASNLIANALKFTPDGGAVHIRAHRAGNDVAMIVTDTGQGIVPEFLPSVFEVFRQADGSTTRMHSGLGLGLSIVKSLVEAHGGTVDVHSAGQDRGATFIVRLPIAVAESSETASDDNATARDSRQQAIPSLEGVRVLIVDDDEESRQVVAAHLTARGAIAVTASSAAEAFELLQHEKVSVLLADIGMPDEDGYALIRRIRALSSQHVAMIPAAALTAFARDEDRVEALHAGFQLHLPKPVEAFSLVSAVATLSRMRTR
jgi:signal transduction histidine kinase/ActR/RegA family two-component response regulator